MTSGTSQSSTVGNASRSGLGDWGGLLVDGAEGSDLMALYVVCPLLLVCFSYFFLPEVLDDRTFWFLFLMLGSNMLMVVVLGQERLVKFPRHLDGQMWQVT